MAPPDAPRIFLPRRRRGAPIVTAVTLKALAAHLKRNHLVGLAPIVHARQCYTDLVVVLCRALRDSGILADQQTAPLEMSEEWLAFCWAFSRVPLLLR